MFIPDPGSWFLLIPDPGSKKRNKREEWKKNLLSYCAAKAFYSCPAIISRRPESQKTPKEPQLNTEEESKIIQARSHITLEKSSRNYKPSEEWAYFISHKAVQKNLDIVGIPHSVLQVLVHRN
jgi:hypothetical protein